MYKIFFTLLLASCSVFPPKPSDELEHLSQDCFKAKKGVDIQIRPIDPEK